MKRMLINATQQEEVRVALVDGQQLYDLDIESKQRDRLKDSIYKGRIARVEPSLQAAFVEIGEGRQAFLPLKAVAPEYIKSEDLELDQEKRNISSIFETGQEVIIQVEKEERGNKGAAVTSYVSIAGRYVVLMPNNPRAGGISRRIEGEERDVTRELLGQLELPNGMGIIIRTGGVGRSVEELQWDLDHLLKLWSSIKEAAEQRDAPMLLFRDSDLMGRAIRDYLSPDVSEILVDDEEAFEAAREFVTQFSPNLTSKVKRYEEKVPLFSYYQIESQIESAYRHRVSLPSGGSIVIERTEALVAIDVNSGRSTAGADIEETALGTNLEAVAEAARQLRLRDIGGIIVLDLIDMAAVRNRRQIEQAMEEALENDRARTQVQRLSRFGLLEMTRERLGASLEETSTQICPRCSGQGRIRDVSSTALSILRLSEEEALKRESSMVRARVPLEVASFLLNEKRSDLSEIEQRTGTHLVIVPTPHFETPHFEIERIRESDAAKEGEVLSYQLMEPPPSPTTPGKPDARRERRPPEPAVVASQRKPSPSPAPTGDRDDSGLFTALRKGLTSLFGSTDSSTKESNKPKSKRGSGKAQKQRSGRQKPATAKGSRDSRVRSKTDAGKPGKDDRNKRRERGRGQGQAKADAKTKDNRRERGQKQAKAERTDRGKPKGEAKSAAAEKKGAGNEAGERFTPPTEGETKRKPKRSRSTRAKTPEQTSADSLAAVDSVPTSTKEPSPAVAPTEVSDEVSDVDSLGANLSKRTESSARPKKAALSSAPKARPQVAISQAPKSFEVETTEIAAPPAERRAPPRHRPATKDSVRPANDPRIAEPNTVSKEFEIEEA